MKNVDKDIMLEMFVKAFKNEAINEDVNLYEMAQNCFGASMYKISEYIAKVLSTGVLPKKESYSIVLSHSHYTDKDIYPVVLVDYISSEDPTVPANYAICITSSNLNNSEYPLWNVTIEDYIYRLSELPDDVEVIKNMFSLFELGFTICGEMNKDNIDSKHLTGDFDSTSINFGTGDQIIVLFNKPNTITMLPNEILKQAVKNDGENEV